MKLLAKTQNFDGPGRRPWKQTDTTKNEWGTPWLCRKKGCAAADSGRATYGCYQKCFICGTQKGAAMNPKREETSEWVVDPTKRRGKGASGSKGSGKGKDSTKGAGKGNLTGTPPDVRTVTAPQASSSSADAKPELLRVPGGSPAQQTTDSNKGNEDMQQSPPRERWQPRALPCEAIDAMNTFQDSWHSVVASTNDDLFPTEEVLPSASSVLEDFLTDDKESEHCKDYTKLKEEVETLRTQIGLGTSGSATDGFLRETLTRQEAALSKAEKKKPTTIILLQSLVTAKDRWELDVKRSRQRATAGAEKSRTRREDRLRVLDDLAQNLDLVRHALEFHDMSLEEAHKERAELLERRDQEVSKLFDDKIRIQKEKEASDTVSSRTTAAQNAAVSQDTQLAQAMAELENSRKKQSLLLEKVQELQKAAGGSTRSVQGVPSGSASSGVQPMSGVVSFVDTEDIFEKADPKDLPDYTPTDDPYGVKQIGICGHWYQLFLLWRQGGCQAVTFGDLKVHSSAGDETAKLMKLLLGERLWDGWFSLLEKDEPDDQVLIPRQALQFVILALEKLKIKHETLQDMKKTAEESYTQITAASKKRRMVAKA